MQKKDRILTFGHIPKFKGGRQQTGLANAIWSLATSMNAAGDRFDVTFCATDIYKPVTNIDGVEIIGWTPLSLLAIMMRHPLKSILSLGRLARSCRVHQQPYLRTALKALLLLSAVERSKPRFIHLHTCESIVFLDADIVDSTKTIVTIHGIFGQSGPGHLSKMEAALTKVSLKSLVFVTNDIASEWRDTYGKPAGPVATILNAYDNQEFFAQRGAPVVKGGDKDSYEVVSVGSVCDRKGQLRVVEALAQVYGPEQIRRVNYTMVGESLPDTFAGDVLQRANEAGVSVRHINYLSPSGLRHLLWKSDYMILATSNEGFGLVFLESIACGTPVVLPKDLPICKESGIISSENALLLDSSSDNAIAKFFQEMPKYAFSDVAVAETIPGFTWAEAGRRYLDLL